MEKSHYQVVASSCEEMPPFLPPTTFKFHLLCSDSYHECVNEYPWNKSMTAEIKLHCIDVEVDCPESFSLPWRSSIIDFFRCQSPFNTTLLYLALQEYDVASDGPHDLLKDVYISLRHYIQQLLTEEWLKSTDLLPWSAI